MPKMFKYRLYYEEDNTKDDTDFYSTYVREALIEDDELTPIEEAFMSGYEEASQESEKMARLICINCGTFIMKSGTADPYICRDCERLMEDAKDVERYSYLDRVL